MIVFDAVLKTVQIRRPDRGIRHANGSDVFGWRSSVPTKFFIDKDATEFAYWNHEDK